MPSQLKPACLRQHFLGGGVGRVCGEGGQRRGRAGQQRVERIVVGCQQGDVGEQGGVVGDARHLGAPDKEG